MAKISVYFNDLASRSKGSLWKSFIKKYLFRHELKFQAPIDLEQLEELLRSDIDRGVDYIFAVGGDGTANTVVQHIHGTNIKLMVIPTGTANDFATEMGLSRNWAKLIKVFSHNTFKRVDVLKINNKYMVSNGGLGLSANVAEKVNSDRRSVRGFRKIMKLTGASIYSMYFAKELLPSLPQYKFHIESPDFPRLEKLITASVIMVNNQSQIGGKFLVAPLTKNNDGKFNVTILIHKKKKDFIKSSLKMLNGKYPSDDSEIISFETDSLDITYLGDKELTFFGDGETLEKGKSFNIGIIPNALSVCSYDDDLLYCRSYSLESIELGNQSTYEANV